MNNRGRNQPSGERWELFMPPEKEIWVGTRFKALLLVVHNSGPATVSIKDGLTETPVELAAKGTVVMQVEYALAFVNSENNPATVEFQVLPVAPWSFWREEYKASARGNEGPATAADG